MHNVSKNPHSNLLPALGHNVGRSLHQPAAKGRVDVVAPLVLTGQLDAVRVKGNNILISVLGQVDREAAGELRLAAGLAGCCHGLAILYLEDDGLFPSLRAAGRKLLVHHMFSIDAILVQKRCYDQLNKEPEFNF